MYKVLCICAMAGWVFLGGSGKLCVGRKLRQGRAGGLLKEGTDRSSVTLHICLEVQKVCGAKVYILLKGSQLGWAATPHDSPCIVQRSASTMGYLLPEFPGFDTCLFTLNLGKSWHFKKEDDLVQKTQPLFCVSLDGQGVVPCSGKDEAN